MKVDTHYVQYDQPRLGRRSAPRQRAICGQMVDAGQHSAEPSCDECRELIADDDRAIAALRQGMR